MGNSSKQDNRYDLDSSTLKSTKQSNKATPTMWKTAESLRPNTEELALACMAGDEQAIAVTEAWRFQTSRATRLVVIPFDDPSFSHVTTFQVRSGGGGTGRKESPVATWVQDSFDEVKAKLDTAFSFFRLDLEDTREGLWVAIRLYCRRWTQGGRQGSITHVGWDEDLVNDLTAHVFEKTKASKFDWRGRYSGWVSTVCFNFCTDSLNSFTKERDEIDGLLTGEQAEAEEDRPAKGYSWGKQSSANERFTLERSKARLQGTVESVIEGLDNQADRAYARFMALGFNQKDAAFEMCESSVTARTRERRIREALQTAGFGVTTPVVMA